MAEKKGIGFVGNVIVDDVSEVLEPGNLVYSDGGRYLSGDDYESERIEYGTGGMALNNGMNLADMGADYPVRVMGKVGCDENADRIRAYLADHGLDDSFLVATPDHPTSTTQVLYVRDSSGSVNRTFRHYFGAVIGGVLERIRSMGILTCIDFVTPKRDRWWKFARFRKTLRWVDILSVGEDQAEGITGLADERAACRSLVEDYGVGLAVVHCGDRETNHLYSSATGFISQPIFIVPPDEYAGNTGAGDAFASGLIHGIHRGWDPAVCLKYATAAATISLACITATGAIREETYILDYMETRPTRGDS